MQLAHSILTFHSSAILNTKRATGPESRLRTTDSTRQNGYVLKLILFTIFTYEQTPMLLDDPVEPKKMTDSIELAAMKNLINEHERFVEIKGSVMPFDSKLIIITGNICPTEFAAAFGNTSFVVLSCRLDLLENVGEEEAAATVATAATTTTTYGYDGYMILDELYKHHVTILNFISIKNCINL